MRDGERKREAYRRMMTLYRGALLQKSELNEWAYPRAVTLHNQYIAGVYDYIDLLKQSGRDEDERRSSASAEARWRESRLTTASTSS